MGGGVTWPPATYDVISRNHSNWPSLNLSQNVSEEWKNSNWKRQVLMFYPLEKKFKKPSRGVGSTPHTLVRPRVTLGLNLVNESWLLNFRLKFLLTGMGHSPHDVTPGGPGVAICLAYFHPKATQHAWTHQEPNSKVPTSVIKAHKSPDHVCFTSR